MLYIFSVINVLLWDGYRIVSIKTCKWTIYSFRIPTNGDGWDGYEGLFLCNETN